MSTMHELERAYYDAVNAERNVMDDCRRQQRDAARTTDDAYRAWRAEHARLAGVFVTSLDGEA